MLVLLLIAGVLFAAGLLHNNNGKYVSQITRLVIMATRDTLMAHSSEVFGLIKAVYCKKCHYFKSKLSP